MPRVSWLSLILWIAVFTSGCALSYQSEGHRGIIGFAWVRYPVETIGGRQSSLVLGKEDLATPVPVVQQKSFGFYLDSSESSAGVGVGYRDLVIVVPAVDAESCIDYDTADPLGARYRVTPVRNH